MQWSTKEIKMLL